MGSTLKSGRYSGTQDMALNALQGNTISASGYSAVQETAVGVLALLLAATNVGASATCDIDVETSHDGVTFYTAASFTQVTSTAGTHNQYKCVPVGRYTRLHYTFGGSGTLDIAFTAEVKS